MKIAKFLFTLRAAYANASPVSEATLEIYAQMLSDIPEEILDKILYQILNTCKFFPTIAEIREIAVNIMTDGKRIPDAIEAWGEVIQQIDLTGYYGMPKFSHPLISETVKMFGWQNLCMSEQLDYDRAHFIKAYESLRKRAIDELRVLPAGEVLASLPEGEERVQTGVRKLLEKFTVR